jgi:hypothetical protein
MAQYDILLTQNVHATLIEYSEQFVNISKGGLLSAIADQTPTVLAGGADGYILARDDVETTGLNWIDPTTLGVTVANQADDRIVTATATADALNAEANLTYNTTQGLLIGAGLGIVFTAAATTYQIYTPASAFKASIDIITGSNSAAGAGDISLIAGAGVLAGGNIYFRRDTTYGNFYFGTGGTGHLPARSSEANVIYYDTITGLLTYGPPTAGGFWTDNTTYLSPPTDYSVRTDPTAGTGFFVSKTIRTGIESGGGTGTQLNVYANGTQAWAIDGSYSVSYLPIRIQYSSPYIYLSGGNSTVYTADSVSVSTNDLTLRTGNATVTASIDSGDLFMYTGSATGTRGSVYFGDGTTGTLTENASATHLVAYNTTTGLLNWIATGDVGSGGEWTVDTNGITYGNNVGMGTPSSATYRLNVSGSIKSSTEIYALSIRNIGNTGGVTYWGGAGTGAHIEMYGGSHATLANRAHYDADLHTFRVQDGSPTIMSLESGAVTITGTLSISGHLYQNDNYIHFFGSSNDAGIYHSSANFFIRSYLHGGGIYIQGENESGENATLFAGDPDGASYMRYANSTKIETSSTGVSITGNLTATDVVIADRMSATQGASSEVVHLDTTGVQTVIRFNNNASIKGYFGYSNSGDTGLAFFSAGGTVRTLIDSSGNFGINQTAPVYKLDVGGSLRISTTSILMGDISVGATTAVTAGYRIELFGTDNKGRAADWTATSDRRLKYDIVPAMGILEKILLTKGMLSTYIRYADEKNTTEIGFIAQDLLPIWPEIVGGSEEEMYDISYMKTGAIAMEGVALVKTEVDGLRERIVELENQVQTLQENG